MIQLKKVRLINWYGFVNETAPIGFFTLIAGKNGNGKSVMLDAIKYAAYGDTVFNKSSESKGSRTISSYTRGLLDATAGTCMRPADKIPNVYTHIVLEYYDEALEKSFVLGTIIETNSSNNYQTYRYVMDKTTLAEIEHTHKENGLTIPYSASDFQKKYQVTLLNREQGLPRFMQMTGLKLTMQQMPTYLRKLRGIMSYDPDAKIDRFIRESVLEQRNVDFAKLIEAKENIERLNETFHLIETEIADLDGILAEYDTYESESNRLLTDDIKIIYKKIKGLQAGIVKKEQDKALAEEKLEQARLTQTALTRQLSEVDARLLQAKVNLQQVNGAQMIAEAERHYNDLSGRRDEVLKKVKGLEEFQTKVSEILHGFFEEGIPAEKKEILASLCGSDYSAAEKQQAADGLKQLVSDTYDRQIEALAEVKRNLQELEEKLTKQEEILENSRKHQNNFDEIPEYAGLRDEINQEFKKRGIASKAQFACEYVIGLKDEAWRDAIEAFLGPRRYTILVEPGYYEIADDVLNRSRFKYAHLFNTALLMKRNVSVEEDSAVHMLEIKNAVAQKYFDFQLGRMHAVQLQEVRNFENAISKEGRVSVSMDSYFLRFERIRFYYLGQAVFELNRKRAECEIQHLKEVKKELLESQQKLVGRRNRLNEDKNFFKDYDYGAPSEYQEIQKQCHEAKEQVKKLKKALENNREYLELAQLVEQLSTEKDALSQKNSEAMKTESEQNAAIKAAQTEIDNHTKMLETEEKGFKEYQITAYAVVQKAVEAYEKYLENGRQGQGGLLAEETRGRINRSIIQHREVLIALQASYNGKHADAQMEIGVSGRETYASRRDRIWMDNLQEIKQKLEEQTRRYEDIFKNEFVLTILKTCEKAQEDLKQINGELAKLHFSAKYQFDVHYVKDGSEYAKILEYARYLNEREKLGTSDGQMTFDMFTAVSDEEGEKLEQELKKIINRIVEKNSEETIARFADYRNYMTYEILISNQILDRAKLSRQTGFNSGAEVQIPYLLILSAALLLIYNQRVNSTRLVFIDEPFAKMDPGNVKVMLEFMREQRLQVMFCAPDKMESIGNECEVILPVLRVRADSMRLGIVQFHEDKKYG